MSNHPSKKPIDRSLINLLPILFFMGRMLLYLAFFPDGLHGFGDFPIYFDNAALPGLPYFHYWSEYPPLYAWTIELIFWISQGNPFIFDFILYLLLTMSGSISIWLLGKIASLLYGEDKQTLWRVSVFFGFLAFSAYSWWYFDLIPVTMMLVTIYYLLTEKDTQAGIWLGLGILTKWFPILLLPAIFRFRNFKQFLKITLIAIGLTVIVWVANYILSPTMTLASLQSQPSRSSWQTIWALIDGNMTTGAFLPIAEKMNPEMASFRMGNPAVIPTWLTLIVFGVIGLLLLLRNDTHKQQSLISMIGITWVLFLIWSPGWSPQWVLYLLPLICLSLPVSKSILLSFGLFFISLIEWPVLLSHHFFDSLWVIVPVRMVLFVWLILAWNQVSKYSPADEQRC
jgi:hypothetical protein